MKKLLTIFMFLVSLSTLANTYYFSASGSDNNAGTQAAPFKSLSKVSVAKSGDVVLLNRGDVFYGALPAISGVTYGAYGTGANPVISGATVLNTWTSVGTGVYEASLSSQPRVVTIAGVQFAPGRYPNTGWLTAGGGGTVSASGLTGLTGGSVVGRTGYFTMEKFPITGQSGSNVSFSGSVEAGYGYFFSDHPATLDQYGEWYYNPTTKKLRVFFGSAGTAAVSASTVDVILNISGANNMSFSGIDFQHGNEWTVKVDQSSNISFQNCGWKFCGVTALLGWTSVTNLSVRNCSISYVNSDGIKLYSGANAAIEDNDFSNIGMFPGEGGVNEYRAISVELHTSPNISIQRNRINNTGYCAISASGANLLIKNNYITNFCTYLSDGGAIYVQDNTESQGKRITGNVILYGGEKAGQGTPYPDVNQAYGIYSDGGNSFTEIDNNSCAFAGAGIYMDDAHDINIHDNTCFGNFRAVSIEYQSHKNETTGQPLTIYNLRLTGNKGVAVGAQDQVLNLQRSVCDNACLPVPQWGVADNNYWSRPLAETNTVYYGNCGGAGGLISLSAYQSASGLDKSSKKGPVAITSPTQLRFEYNPSGTAKTVSLGGNYVTVDGLPAPGTITLQPYSSAILFATGSAPPPNQPPTANAGPDQTITLPVNSVTLNGTGTDPENGPLTYSWSNGATTASTVAGPLTAGTYTYTLTVKDNAGASASDQVTVTVLPAAPVSFDTTYCSVVVYVSNTNVSRKTVTYFVKRADGLFYDNTGAKLDIILYKQPDGWHSLIK